MMTEQINGLQAKVQEQLKGAQAKATARAKEIEAEARKAFETFTKKYELNAYFDKAEHASREGLYTLGGELVKLGKKLQEYGTEPKATPVEVKEELKVEGAPAEAPQAQA